MEVSDYCGYCGKEFARNESDLPEVCPSCLNDPAFGVPARKR